MQAKIKVKLKQNSYDIIVGINIINKTGDLIKSLIKGKRILIVSNKKIFKLYGNILLQSLKKYYDCSVFLIGDGEKYKNIHTLLSIFNKCAEIRLDRNCGIAALGGGVVGDIAGFAASTYMRGINLIHIPTSLVAQADSSIGGKTGIDLKAGKNLVGSFYQPRIVITDISLLSTLPEVEFKNGLTEVIKYGIIMDAPFFYFLKRNLEKIKKRDKKVLFYMVKKSIQNKVKIVEKDEKETSGLRAILNYGHTIGHAIESAGGYKLYKHGEAVAIGIYIAALIAYKMKICSKATFIEQKQILKLFNLIKPLKKIKISDILKKIIIDKKAINDKIRFILTKKIGYVSFIQNIDLNLIKRGLEEYNNYFFTDRDTID
ncbi:MAG: 3-dehydroquinate synthase [Candidatus Goldbacteria bacterium]|nr:3-dehydroquinate synthase [Candidatus Goldiibacteriota bacterium]